MSNLEPTDVGPAAGGDRPVAEGDRQHVLTLLNSAHAEGLLTTGERDRRLADARAAVTFDDLVPLTRDLVSGRPSVDYDTAHASGSTDPIVAIFGGTRRNGRWRVHPDTNITAAFGGVELDLSEAIFEATELQITVNCLFGGVELTVPEGTEVISRVAAVFGGADVHRLAPPQPGMPRIIVTGFVLFGGLNVRNRRGAEQDALRASQYADRVERHALRHVERAQRHAERIERRYHG